MSQSHFSDSDVFSEAAFWSQRLRGEAPFDAEGFNAWLSANPLHGEALAEIEAACELLSRGRDLPEVLKLRDEARQSARYAQTRISKDHTVSKRVLMGAIAASVVAAVGVGVTFPILPRETRYETRTGEQRTVTLQDGSTINLDTASSVRVVYGMSDRLVILVAGRAHFEIAKNPSRPFSVDVDDKRVQALGTAFTIDRSGRDITVTLVEGKIRIGSGDKTNIKWITSALKPGDQATLTHGSEALKIKEKVDLGVATGWRSGMLTFDDEPLENVVARMNTYSDLKVVINERELQEMRVSGSFPARETERFVKALENYYPVQSRREDRYIHLESRRNSK